jgi:hypothetical protein
MPRIERDWQVARHPVTNDIRLVQQTQTMAAPGSLGSGSYKKVSEGFEDELDAHTWAAYEKGYQQGLLAGRHQFIEVAVKQVGKRTAQKLRRLG